MLSPALWLLPLPYRGKAFLLDFTPFVAGGRMVTYLRITTYTDKFPAVFHTPAFSLLPYQKKSDSSNRFIHQSQNITFSGNGWVLRKGTGLRNRNAGQRPERADGEHPLR